MTDRLDGPDELAIVLPMLRQVRESDYFPRVYGAFLVGQSWADDEAVELLSKHSAARRHAASMMRNSLWSVRNHRTRAIERVLDEVREFAATERALQRAGVHPMVTALYADFHLDMCRCKGDCQALDFDLADPESAPREWCEHFKLRGRQIVDTDDWSLPMIARALRR